MQTMIDWYKGARCPGIFRYHSRKQGKLLGWILLIMLGSRLLSLLMPLLFDDMQYMVSGGIAANIATPMFFVWVFSWIAAISSTRFLLRFGTPRGSVWLCNLISIFVSMIVLLLGTLMISILISYLTLPLLQNNPRFTLIWTFARQETVFDAAFLAETFKQAIAALPGQILLIAEYVSISYLFGCCLRRSQGWTLAVIIGVPLAISLLTLIPAVHETMSVVVDGNRADMTLQAMRWMEWLNSAIKFVREEWPLIQGIAALVALPLSYLCMRGTKQP